MAASPTTEAVPATDNPPPAGPEPDATKITTHPSISLSALAYAAEWAMAQAHAGSPSALVRFSFTGPVQMYPEEDLRLSDGINVVLDFNEAKQPIGFTLSAEPSPITLTRLAMEATLLKDRMLREYCAGLGIQPGEVSLSEVG